MSVCSDQRMLSGGVRAAVSVWRGALAEAIHIFSSRGPEKWEIWVVGHDSSTTEEERCAEAPEGQLSCFQIRVHVFVWKWDVWRGLSLILVNLEQDNDIITVTSGWSMHIGSLFSVAWKPYICSELSWPDGLSDEPEGQKSDCLLAPLSCLP